jgi:O-acetyl-ADP-ribose deacetylase (regulator of RNase III)
MRQIHDDLIEMALEHQFDVIAHGCNCFCNMGAGIAKQIKQTFPDAFFADCKTIKGDKSKLGNISVAYQHGVTIVNAYTQYSYGKGLHADYNAIRSCMKHIKKQFSGKAIGLPLIGAGHAGDDWGLIVGIIKEELDGENYTIVIYKES